MLLKNNLCQRLQKILSEKMESIQEAMAAARESRDADTKSSAGDKHETSRALAQIEMDKLEVQWNKMLVLEKELNSIDVDKKYEQVEVGSLVFTNHENYFISVGLGKIEMNGNTFYAISLASPVGAALKWKKVGDKVVFNGRELVIEGIQ